MNIKTSTTSKDPFVMYLYPLGTQNSDLARIYLRSAAKF